MLWCKKAAKIRQGKLNMKWEGPYVVTQKYNKGTVELSDNNGQRLEIFNGNKLKQYHEWDGTHLGEIQRILEEEKPEEELSAIQGTQEVWAVHLSYIKANEVGQSEESDVVQGDTRCETPNISLQRQPIQPPIQPYCLFVSGQDINPYPPQGEYHWTGQRERRAKFCVMGGLA